MESILFLAPPAAGKGTQSMLVCDKYGIPHISTGDLLRDEMNQESEFGIELKEKMKQGILISDDIILSLLKKRLQQKDCDHGYVLDGFPRTENQAIEYQKMLDTLGKKIEKVIVIDVDFETLKRRIIGRSSCKKCGTVYNELIEEAKPKKQGICDKCGVNLFKREDDNEESFEKRLQVYHDQTEPLINYYQNLGILVRVDGNRSSHEVFENIVRILDGVDTDD